MTGRELLVRHLEGELSRAKRDACKDGKVGWGAMRDLRREIEALAKDPLVGRVGESPAQDDVDERAHRLLRDMLACFAPKGERETEQSLAKCRLDLGRLLRSFRQAVDLVRRPVPEALRRR